MKTIPGLLAILLATSAAAQTTPAARPPAARASQTKAAGPANAMRPPDPDLFDGTRFEKEVRPETGMIGEFEMPGSADSQDSKVGGNPAQGGGGQPPPDNKAAAAGASGGAQGAQGAQSQAGASGGGAQGAQGAEGGAGGSSGAENGGAGGAVGGALDQSKPMSNSGQSGAGGSSGSPEGMAADNLKGGGAAADAAAKAAGPGKSAGGRIGSAELRIETLPESEKDVVGREAAAGGTQGSNRAMPAGKGGQGSQNQNKGVEKGKVIPKGL